MDECSMKEKNTLLTHLHLSWTPFMCKHCTCPHFHMSMGNKSTLTGHLCPLRVKVLKSICFHRIPIGDSASRCHWPIQGPFTCACVQSMDGPGLHEFHERITDRSPAHFYHVLFKLHGSIIHEVGLITVRSVLWNPCTWNCQLSFSTRTVSLEVHCFQDQAKTLLNSNFSLLVIATQILFIYLEWQGYLPISNITQRSPWYFKLPKFS